MYKSRREWISSNKTEKKIKSFIKEFFSKCQHLHRKYIIYQVSFIK